jgi:hypothetical protein
MRLRVRGWEGQLHKTGTSPPYISRNYRYVSGHGEHRSLSSHIATYLDVHNEKLIITPEGDKGRSISILRQRFQVIFDGNLVQG